DGTCINKSTVLVSVYPSPTVIIGPGSPSVCSGLSTVLSGSGAVSYTWQPANISNSQLTVTPLSTTIYTLTGENAFTCKNSATITVSVAPTPTLFPAVSQSTICSGKTTSLGATGASNYTWNPGNLIGPSPTVSPLSTTVYTVTGAIGTCVSSKT